MSNPEVNMNKPNFSNIAPELVMIDDHITLRTLGLDEAEVVFEAVDRNREKLAKWLPWVASTRTAGDSQAFIEEVRGERELAQVAPYGIFLDGQFAGHISLMARDENVGEIGYWLDDRMYGKGLATITARKLTDLAFNNLGCRSVIILAAEGNKASQDVARRLDFIETPDIIERDGEKLIRFEVTKACGNE